MDEYTKLKNQVLDELIKITDEEELTPLEKFEFLMTQYASNGNTSLLNKAFISAQEIENVSEKGQALMQLLEEIDIAQVDLNSEQAKSTESAKDSIENKQSVSVDN